MRKNILFLVFLVCAQWMLAQNNISVTSFRALENDLTANTFGTSEKDQNGEIAALIKIVTNETGFLFDGGMTGIVKVKQDVGEVWVYVPHGIKRITIKHPQLGVLRDYYFPIPIEKARTYEMLLSTGKVQTIVQHTVNKQYVIFNVEPANAVVELGDEILTLDEYGTAQKSMSYGKYNYRVSCANYHTQAGVVQVNSKGKAVIDVTLKPNFGWLKLDAANDEMKGSYVFLDNERVGQLPFISKDGLRSGTHHLRVLKPMYKPFEQQVTIADGDTTAINVDLQPNFALVTLNTAPHAEIWIDGQQKTIGTWTGPLEMGEYTIEVKAEAHRSMSHLLEINDLEAREVQLPNPEPICGSLDISSSPSFATVFIDGEKLGETPLIQNNVLVGQRELIFRKRGFNDVLKVVEVKENETTSLSVRMTKGSTHLESEVVRKREEAARLAAEADSLAAAQEAESQIQETEPQSEVAPQEPAPTPVVETEIPQPMPEQPAIEPVQKMSPASYYKTFALYFEGNGEYDLKAQGMGFGGGLGLYIAGINLQATYQMAQVGRVDLRTGLGLKLGRFFMMTPQVGYSMFMEVPCEKWTSHTDSEGYFYLYHEEYTEQINAISLACRFQACLTKNIALSITPEYRIFEEGVLEPVKGVTLDGFNVRAGLVINFGQK